MDFDATYTLREQARIKVGADGVARIQAPTTGEMIPIQPEALYLLSLLAKGGSVGAVVERTQKGIRDGLAASLDFLVKNEVLGNYPPFVPSVQAHADQPSVDQLPVFILGCNRSGTTLMRWILDSHPHICCIADTMILQSLKETFWGDDRMRNLRGLGVSDQMLRRKVLELVRSVYTTVADQSGKRRWADKTNAYSESGDFLVWLFEGQCRFIVVVRHGLDVASSDYYSSNSNPWATAHGSLPFPLESQVQAWSRINGYLARFATRNPHLVTCVRYEDLVREPVKWMEHVFGFIGEDTPHDMVSRIFEQDHNHGQVRVQPEDYKIKGTTGFETDRIGRWRQWPGHLVGSVAALVNPVLRLWGYDEIPPS